MLPESPQRQRFFELWTLKESDVKSRGMGLSIPLNKFPFDLDS
jgi:4'-phosphopantetheinyl transferase